ncbi:MAG: tRNA epoxyqueuosine(34) reductase QueG [Acidimicrobiales bacterium]|jgi:epoxyqueuosine reductase|nr:tRNA epoxyqueuosine(34) reductase QueG [Acidimicrobiales bacterium]
MVTLDELDAIARANGLCAFGITTADPFPEVRIDLEERKAAGFDGGMQFTYRNPARSTEPDRSLPGAATLLVGAYDYQREAPDHPLDGPQGRVAAYSWEDHYAVLRAALEAVAEPLRAAGHRATVLADQNHLVDRAVAHRAGIGWWGKSSNILVPGVGSLVVLGSVLTDAPIEHEPAPAVDDGCRTCTQCLTGCPTGAIVAPGVVDGRRCLAWLLQADGWFPVEYRVALGDRLYGCDDCQDVCPPNQVRRRRPSDAGDDGAWVPILDALRLDDDALMTRLGRWYIPNRDPAYLRRNLLVVLGNIGEPGAPETATVLGAALEDERAMVRAHAVWAARRLGLDGLLVDITDEAPEVRTELAREVPPADASRPNPSA